VCRISERAQRHAECGAVGEGIAEGHAELNDVGAGFGKRKNELQRGIE